jgi:hypothetical protein
MKRFTWHANVALLTGCGCIFLVIRWGDFFSKKNEDTRIRLELSNKCGENEDCYVSAARRDFNAGKLCSVCWWLIDRDSVSYMCDCLEVSKKVNMIGTGCVSFSYEKYNETMVSLLKTRYGDNFFDSCKGEARTFE